MWCPELGEGYFYITIVNVKAGPYVAYTHNCGFPSDIRRFSKGNVFSLRCEADEALQRVLDVGAQLLLRRHDGDITNHSLALRRMWRRTIDGVTKKLSCV